MVMPDVRNVFLITADALRYDHFEPNLCPELCTLADSGVHFPNTFSTGSGTSSAFPGILASALPLDHGYRGLNQNHTPLAEHLSQNGVHTTGVTSSSHASSLFNYNRGFDDFIEDPSYRADAVNDPPLGKELFHEIKSAAEKNPITRKVGSYFLEKLRSFDRGSFQYPYDRAEVVTQKAIEAIDALDMQDPEQRHFIWIHYMEPHSPYYPPDNILAEYHDEGWTKGEVHDLILKWYANRRPLWSDNEQPFKLNRKEIKVLLDFYQAQIRYLDREFGRLLNWLEDRHILEDSMMMFTSDHGEEFFDHGDFGHRQKLYNELIHVPFIINDGQHRGEVTVVASHLDIAPTTCEALGCEPSKEWRGSSLIPLITDDGIWEPRDHVISELSHWSVTDGYGGDVRLEDLIVAVMTQEWKYILNRQKESEELYRMKEDENPENNQIEHSPDIVESFQKIVDERISDLSEISHDRQKISKEVRDRLHELGYTGE